MSAGTALRGSDMSISPSWRRAACGIRDSMHGHAMAWERLIWTLAITAAWAAVGQVRVLAGLCDEACLVFARMLGCEADGVSARPAVDMWGVLTIFSVRVCSCGHAGPDAAIATQSYGPLL